MRLQKGGKFESFFQRFLPNREKLRQQIMKTGKNISLSQYGMWVAIAALICFLLVRFWMGFPPLVAILGGIAGGMWIPWKILQRMEKKRLKLFLGHFAEAIDTMVRGLRSGLPVTESINAVGREMPDPVGFEFRAIGDAVRVGRSLDEAMWDVAKRIDTPELRFLIISMAIQRETGGNLAETLGNLADLLRRRRQLKLKIRAMSSEARASAMIIGSLPFVMWCLLFLVNKAYATTLFTDDRGIVMAACGAFWMFLGVMVMKKMIEFEI